MQADQKQAYEKTELTRVRRRPDRGRYDRETVHRILDEALVCHVGFSAHGQTFVLPTTVVREGEFVYIHGSTNNHLLTSIGDGTPACLTVTLIDSIVAGRSGFGCSMDYRSVMIFAKAEIVTDVTEKARLIDVFVQDIMPGHVVRPPKPKEIAATLILRFPIDEVSAKVRDVGNLDVDGDYELDLWAGVIPLRIEAGPPRSCPRLKDGIAVPPFAERYAR